MVNSAQQREHPMWQTSGLGLQDATGAVSIDLIEMEDVASTAMVDFPLDFSLHRTADQETLSEIPPHTEKVIHSSTCFELYGHCQTEQYHNLAVEFARGLTSLVVAQKLACGTVIGLKPLSEKSANIGEHYFFLGVLLKRPMLQVLAEAMRNGSSFSMFEV